MLAEGGYLLWVVAVERNTNDRHLRPFQENFKGCICGGGVHSQGDDVRIDCLKETNLVAGTQYRSPRAYRQAKTLPTKSILVAVKSHVGGQHGVEAKPHC